MQVIWLMFTLLVSATIAEIRIGFSMNNKDKIIATISGYESGAITQADLDAFEINEQKLKDQVRKKNGKFDHFEVYIVRHPERGDLYKTRNWPPLRVKTTPILINITKQYTNPIENLVRRVVNRSPTDPLTESHKITDQKTIEIQNKWKTTKETGITASVTVGYSLAKVGIEGSSVSTWGKENKVIGKTKTSITCTTTVTANPKEKVSIHTNVTEQILEVEAQYLTALNGFVVVEDFPHYVRDRFGVVYPGDPKYYFYNITDLEIPNTINTKQTMTINFNKEFKVIVENKPLK